MTPLPRTDSTAPRGPDPQANAPTAPLSDAPSRDDVLAAGSRLDEFEIERVLGTSGFGVVYLATDLGLQRRVAIKEYLPDTLCVRGDDKAQVLLRAPSHAEAFERGRRAFVEEAQVLARCDHPSLLHVLRHWEANGTVYRAMPYYQGTSLLALRQAMEAPPDEPSLRGLVDGLLEALAMLHEAGCVHRDITPSNIMLLPDDRPVLMDYGAARRAIVGDQARALMTLLAPSFAAPEQTAPSPDRPIGPWTDLYALGAVVRYCISGQLPASAARRTSPADESVARMFVRVQEAHPSLHFSASFIAAIEAALAPRPQDRPQSVADFRALLDNHPAAQALPEDRIEPDFDSPAPSQERGWGQVSSDDQQASFAPPAAAGAQPSPKAAFEPSPLLQPRFGAPAAPLSQEAGRPRQSGRPAAAGDVSGERRAPSAAAREGTAQVPPLGAPPTREQAASDRADIPANAGAAAATMAARPSDFRAASPDTVSQFRHTAQRRRRRVAWLATVLLVGAAGAGVWWLDEQRASDEAQSAFARAARQDGLTAGVPAVPRSPQTPSAPALADGGEPAPLAAQTAAPPTQASSDAAAVAAAATPATPAASAAVTAEPPQPQGAVAQGDPAVGVQPAATPTAAPAVAVAPPATTAADEVQANVAAPVAEESAARVTRAREPVSTSGTRAAASRTGAGEGTRGPAPARTTARRDAIGPRDICGDRTQFSLYRCMQTQCAQAKWVQHPSCKRLRLRDEVD